MSEKNPLDTLNRRDLVLGASVLAMFGIRDAAAAAHTGPRIELTEAQQAALEKAVCTFFLFFSFVLYC